jgi:hypothetical protein
LKFFGDVQKRPFPFVYNGFAQFNPALPAPFFKKSLGPPTKIPLLSPARRNSSGFFQFNQSLQAKDRLWLHQNRPAVPQTSKHIEFGV